MVMWRPKNLISKYNIYTYEDFSKGCGLKLHYKRCELAKEKSSGPFKHMQNLFLGISLS